MKNQTHHFKCDASILAAKHPHDDNHYCEQRHENLMQALNYQQAVVSTNPSMTGSQSSSVDGSNGAESQYLTEFYPPPSLPELPPPPTNDAVTAHALLNLSSSNQSAEQESNDPSGLSQPFPPQDGVAHSHELEGISGTAAGMDGLAPSSSAIAAPAPALGSASAVARAPQLAASTNSAASANGQGNIGHAAAVQQPPSHPNMSMNNNHNMAFAPSANEAAATPSASNGYATPMQMMMPGYLNLPQQFPGPQFFQAQNQFQAQQGQFQPQQASPFPFMNQNFFPFPQMMQQGGIPVMPNGGMGMAPNGTDIMSQVNAFNNYMANSTAAQAATPVTAAPYATSAAKIVNTPASNNETQAKPRKRSLSNGGSKTTKKPSPTQAKNSAKPQVAPVCSKKKDNSAKGDGSTQAKRPRHNLLVNASNKIAKTTNDPNIKNAAKNSSTEIEKASLSDYNENLNQSAPGYEESVGPQEQEATFRIPCPRRGMTTYHNSKTAYFVLQATGKNGDSLNGPDGVNHGVDLHCSFEKCRNDGCCFVYCGYCKRPMAKKSFHRLHDHGHFDGKILGQYSSSTSKDGSPSTYVAASAPEINGAAEDSIAQKKNENDNMSSFSGNASVASSSPERAVAPPKAIPKATSNAKVYPYKPHKKLVPTGPPQHDRFHFFSSHPTHKELVRDPDSGQWIPVEDGAPPTPQVQQVLPQAWHTPSPFHQLPHATAKTPVQQPSFPTKKSAAPSSNNKATTTKKSKEKKSVAKKTGAAAVLPPPNGNQDNTSQDDALPSLSIDTTNNAHTTVKKTAENSPVAFETTAALISTPTNIPGTTTTTVAIATDAQVKDQDKSHAEPNQHDSGTTQSVSDKHDDAPSPSVNKSIITIRAGNYVVTAEPALSPRSQVQSIDQTEPDQEMKMPSLVETTKATASASIQKSDQAKPVQHLNELLSTYSTVLSSIKKSDQAAPDQHENVPSSTEIEDITKVASIQKSDQAAPDQHQNVPSSVEIENTTKVAGIQKSDQAAPDQHEHVQSSAEPKRTSTGASIQKSDQTAPTQHEYVQSSAKSKSTSIGASIYNNKQGDAPEEHANVLTSAEAKNSTTGASTQNSVQVAPKQQENVPSTIETNNTGTVASIQNSVQGDVPDQHAKVPSLVETKNTTPEHTIAEGESFDDCYDSAYGEYERKRRWEELLTQRPSKQECIDDKKAMQIWMREVLRVSDFSQNYH